MSLLVCVVDDDRSMRESLVGLLSSAGYRAEAFASGEAFLATDAPLRAAVLVLDVRMPGLSGPALWESLIKAGTELPVIFITGQPTDELRERMMRAGAAGFFPKPFDDGALLDAIANAYERAHTVV